MACSPVLRTTAFAMTMVSRPISIGMPSATTQAPNMTRAPGAISTSPQTVAVGVTYASG